MKTLKKTLAMLLCALLLMSVGALAGWAEPIGVEALTFSTTEDGVMITRCDKAVTGALEIPAEINGKPVVAIGGHAFQGAGFSSITIPESVKTIGTGAFGFCPSLTALEIPAGVEELGKGIASACPALTSLTVAAGNPVYHSAGNCVINTATKELVCGTNVSVIPADGSVTSIGDFAFFTDDKLTSVAIPEGVTSLGYEAFYGCAALEEITLPESLTEFGEGAFAFCPALTSITIPDAVTMIAHHAFVECTGLKEIGMGKNVTIIGVGAFYGCTGLTSIVLPDSLEIIGDDAFAACTGLESITLPGGLEIIADNAFYGCSALESVVLPAGLKTIKMASFASCTGLKDVYYPGTEEMWGDVVIGEGNEELRNATLHFGPMLNPAIEIQKYQPTLEVDYKTTVIFKAIVTDAPEGAVIQWFVNDEKAEAAETCTVEKAKADYTVQVKLLAADGEVLAESETETVKVNQNFFQKLIAFFKGLFGLLPTITQAFKG
ncbi:MAG: leucine-rich repeat protein [Clostridia bacterium]|nr:leucine-rich repeat protein [Clostridia bacterium]